MLENIDLSRKLKKVDYKTQMNALELKLASLQREALTHNIPIVLCFEGWDAAGKGTLINDLILPLDPRGFSVYSTLPPNEEATLRPFLWRFWNQTPRRGRITIFDRSWYRRILNDRVDRLLKKHEQQQAYEDIRSFERQLTDDGAVIIKLFLHISKAEQKRRFERLRSKRRTAWRVTRDDLKRHKQYDKYLAAAEDMLAETDTDHAPWTIIEAHDQRFASVKIFTAVIAALKRAVATAKRAQKRTVKAIRAPARKPMDSSILAGVDLDVELTRDVYRRRLKAGQKRIRELEHEIYMRRIPVIIVYQGWDAAGKGGNIRRLTENLDPRGYEVIPIAAPNDEEKAHHYLWRFWREIPKAGHIAIFDRSWYGRVMVERVEGFCSEAEWRRAYREINEMEQHLANYGTVLVKFWLHISAEEQLQRFQAREKTAHKRWKITDEDWRNREKWDLYHAAVEEMLFRTSTPYAPWTIVESNCKWYARVKALETVIAAIEAKL